MSSVVKRLMGWRQEASSREHPDQVSRLAAGKTAAPTFVPDLIRNKIENKHMLTHLAQVAVEDPIAKYIVRNISVNSFDDWFILVDLNGKEHPKNAEIQKKLKRLDAQFIYTQCTTIMRAQGWCWQFVGKEKPQDGQTSPNRRVANYDYFSPLEMGVKKYNRDGTPKILELKIKVPGYTALTEGRPPYSAKDFVVWNTDPISRKSFKGYPATWAAWDALTELRYAFNAITWYVMKVGMGAWVVELKKTLDDAEVSAIQNMFQSLGPRTVAMVNKDKTENIEFKGGQMSTSSFIGLFDGLLGRVSAATGIPRDVFIGASAGKIVGSDVILKSLYQVLNGVQSGVERPIRQNIDRLDPSYIDLEYEFKWGVKFVPDAKQEADIGFINAEELSIRGATYLTKNEIREMQGLDPLPGGDILPGQFEVTNKGAEPSSQSDKLEATENTLGKN